MIFAPPAWTPVEYAPVLLYAISFPSIRTLFNGPPLIPSWPLWWMLLLRTVEPVFMTRPANWFSRISLFSIVQFHPACSGARGPDRPVVEETLDDESPNRHIVLACRAAVSPDTALIGVEAGQDGAGQTR